MEAQRATETTLMMIMSSDMVMTKREPSVLTNSRLNVNVRLAPGYTALTWIYVSSRTDWTVTVFDYEAEHCNSARSIARSRLDVLVEWKKHAWKAI